VRRGVLAFWFGLLSVVGASATPALAAPQASFDFAPDGTLVVVGNGWRPAQVLVIRLGSGRFVAYTDSSGEFEVPTGLATYMGPLSIHRQELASSIASPASDQLHPFAVLFAQSLVQGSALLAICAAVALTARPLFGKRR
jgi:hypothetical protein